MQQLSPYDMTSILQTDVSVLRTGLLSVKSHLQPLVNFSEEVSKKQLVEAITKSVESIDDTLVELKEIDDRKGANA